jgi:hypothetical protein
MPKSHKFFSFIYPLKQKRVRDLKIVTDHIGDLLVEGTGYFDPSVSTLDIFDRYDVDIDTIKWNGTDILPVLEVTGFLEEITEAAIRQFANAHDTSWRQAA